MRSQVDLLLLIRDPRVLTAQHGTAFKFLCPKRDGYVAIFMAQKINRDGPG